MKTAKQSVVKRIAILFCCTLLISSNIFLSYENSMIVKAADMSDLLRDFIFVSLAAIGVYVSGGAASELVLALAPYITNSGFDIYDYVTQDTEAGTTTISADFVNLVLAAYKKYNEENGLKFDGSMSMGDGGLYYFSDLYMTKTNYDYDPSNRNYYSTIKYTDIYTRLPCAVIALDNYDTGSGYFSGYDIIYYDASIDCFYGGLNSLYAGNDTDFGQALQDVLCPKKSYLVRTGEHDYEGIAYLSATLSNFQGYSWGKINCTFTVSSSSIPIYTTLSSLKNGLCTGDFSAAYNYGTDTKPPGSTDLYNGTYDGGDITVNTELLEGISDKIKELDETDKSILEKLQELLDWLKQGGGSGSGDVNIDIDLSTTNLWLSKIYAKVSQIFDQMHSGGSDGSGSSIFQKGIDAVLSRLDELDRTLKKYLSEITGDLDDIKSQLKDMSEEEFNEKSDSFLGGAADAFSEIADVAKTKFPFSIPNDLRIFISKIAPSSGEGEPQQHSVHTSGTALYSGGHGGGGSSRPGSGFVDVEHGGGGSSRDPVVLEGSAPVFYLPIAIERYGIEEYIVIDMAPFDPLSRFSRGFFTILFIACLYNLTFKVIGMWGDLIG